MMQNNNTSGFWAGADTAPPHLTQSIALEESGTPGIIHSTVTIVGILMAVFLVWATFANIDEIATSAGQVVPSGYIQTIQHPDGGVIQDILVQEGDLVEKGQPLVRFDATNANADLGQMRARQESLQLQAARLRSYTDTQRDIADRKTLTPEEADILMSMEAARTQQLNVLHNQIAQKEKELVALSATRAALQRNVALKKEENKIYQDTLKRGSSSRLMALTSERELNQLEGQLQETISQENRAHDAVDEAKNRVQSLSADLRQQAMKDLGQVESELGEISQSIGRQEKAADRIVLTAPARGIVKGLMYHTIGAVVEPGRIIMEIVPVDEELLVEALVSPADIGNLELGQAVKVKVSAFDFSRYGTIAGTLNSISASTFENEKGEFFYKARVKLEQNYVGKTEGRNLILPGMTVQADIITGTKTIMQYLLKPVQQATQNAFHER